MDDTPNRSVEPEPAPLAPATAHLPPLLTVEEYCALRRCRPKTLYDRKLRGVGPQPRRVGGRLLYRREEVLAELGLDEGPTTS